MNMAQLPPENPHALGDMLVSLVRLLADPQAAQERIRDYMAADATARAAIEQAARDTAAAAKVRQDAEAEIARQREQWDFQQRHESDLHREKMTAERNAAEGDRKAARAARVAAERDATEAAELRADLAKRVDAVRAAAGIV